MFTLEIWEIPQFFLFPEPCWYEYYSVYIFLSKYIKRLDNKQNSQLC